MKEKVVFTTLSTLPKEIKKNIYCYEDKYCSGVHQQEPAIKCFLSENQINRIVFLGSKETLSNDDTELINSHLSNWRGKLCKDSLTMLSSFRLLVYRLADFVYGDENDCLFTPEDKIMPEEEYSEKAKIQPCTQNDITICFVNDKSGFENGIENFKELIETIRNGHSHDTELYIDIQGGNRSSLFVNSSLLQLLGKKQNVYHINIKRILATDYSKGNAYHLIRDQEDRLSITELFSGMDAFFNYGKADALISYIESLKDGSWTDDKVKGLVNALRDIDNAITFGRILDSGEDNEEIMSLPTAIKDLKKSIDDIKTQKISKTHTGAIFSILIDSIVEDFGDLLNNDNVDFIPLVKWRMSKNDIITSAIVIESLLPRYLASQKLLYLSDFGEDKNKSERYLSLFKLSDYGKNQNDYKDIDHYLLKVYLRKLGYFFNFDPKHQYKPNKKLRFLFNPNLFYPLRLKSNWNDEKLEEVLARYTYIAKNRNKLAHLGENAGTQTEFICCIEGLINCLESAPGIRNTSLEYKHAPIVSFNSSLELFNTITDLIRGELYSGYYGPLTNSVEYFDKKSFLQRDDDRKNYESLFLIGPLLKPLIVINDLSIDCEKANNLIFGDKNADIWIKLCIDYYNENKTEENQISYDSIRNLKKKSEKQSYTDLDVVNRIKTRLSTYDDFCDLMSHLSTRVAWDEYILSEKEKLENCNNYAILDMVTITEVLQPVLVEDGWKKLIMWFCSDKDRLTKFLEIIGSPYANLIKLLEKKENKT